MSDLEAARGVVERFNRLVPVGTLMLYYPVGGAYMSEPQGPFKLESGASVWGGDVVVKLAGKSGVVSLSHCSVYVSPLPEAKMDGQRSG